MCSTVFPHTVATNTVKIKDTVRIPYDSVVRSFRAIIAYCFPGIVRAVVGGFIVGLAWLSMDGFPPPVHVVVLVLVLGCTETEALPAACGTRTVFRVLGLWVGFCAAGLGNAVAYCALVCGVVTRALCRGGFTLAMTRLADQQCGLRMLPTATFPGETDCDSDASDAVCKAWPVVPPSGQELLPGSGVVAGLAYCAVLLAVSFWLELLLILSKKYERKLSVSGALSPTPLLRLNSPKASPALCQVASAGVM